MNKEEYKPWEAYSHIWKTQAAFMSFIRGGVRRGLWMRHPVKLEFLQKNRIRAPIGRKTKNHPEGQEVWACKCSQCGGIFRQSDVEVDHIVGNHSLKTIDDLDNFLRQIVYIKDEELQIICKGCHKIKSYAEKEGISFELAKATKEVIALEKEKKLLQWLEDRDILPASNAKLRRQQAIDYLTLGE